MREEPQPKNEFLELLTPPPEEKLQGWLNEFYGRPVKIAGRELLRYRDLSLVERLTIADSLPASLIYKVVAPPWDVELDLHQRVLVPSITSSPTLYMSAHHNAPASVPGDSDAATCPRTDLTVMFFEDLGPRCLKREATAELATALGEKLARLHRAYSYRTDELKSALQTIAPANYVDLTVQICEALSQWNLLQHKTADENAGAPHDDDGAMLLDLARSLSRQLSEESFSLVHGDFFAENLIPRAKARDGAPDSENLSLHDDSCADEIYIIDWSWFAFIGVPLMDLATVTMDHFKNGELFQYRRQIIEAYCFESGRQQAQTEKLLPAAQTLSRLLFLNWLVVRRTRGIMGTTVGHVDDLIVEILSELAARRAAF